MLYVFKILPLALHFIVGFHLDISLSPFKAIFLIPWDEVVE